MSERSYSDTDLVHAVKRRQKMSLIATIVVTIVLAVGIGSFLTYSIVQIGKAQADLKDRQTELANVDKQLNDEKARLADAQAQRREVVESIQYVRAQLAQIPSTALKGLPAEALAAAQSSVQQAVPANPPQGGAVQAVEPRVYIHVRSADQAGIANQIAEKLRTQGIVVPRDEILTDVGPQNSELRFFKNEDQDEAKKILGLLGEAVPSIQWKTNWVRGYETSTAIRPKHFEVWLGRNAAL